MPDDITPRPGPSTGDGEDRDPQSTNPLEMFGAMMGPGGLDPARMGAMIEQVLGEAQSNPELADMLRQMGVDPTDPGTRAQMQAGLQTFMRMQSSPGGAQETATSIARHTVMAGEGNDVHDSAADSSVTDAVHVATMWLDEVTTLAAPSWRAAALSRAEWVEETMPRWHELVAPIAEGVTSAVGGAIRKQLGELGPDSLGELADLPPEVRAMMPEGFDPASMLDQLAPMLSSLSKHLFTSQLGQGVGALAAEVVTANEVGLPLTEPGLVALLPGNVRQLATDLELDEAQVSLYLAVREAARVRLFTAVPWYQGQLVAAVADYARNISIDTEAIESAMTQVDPRDMQAMQQALQGNLFRPSPTPAQRAALTRLETLLALGEGWVDHVTAQAAGSRLPSAAALSETIRRRRVGGAAQKAFSGLVGLELTPRRLRDAANVFAALEDKGGAALRDRAWDHPDVAPTAADLDDVIGYVERVAGGSSADESEDELDAVLRGILDEADGRGEGTGEGMGYGGER